MSSTHAPRLPTINGEKHVVELRGASKTRKVHRHNPTSSDPVPWCREQSKGYIAGSSQHDFKFRRLGMARVWREPCRVCFPEGFDE